MGERSTVLENARAGYKFQKCDDYCSNIDEPGIEQPADEACICNPILGEDFAFIVNNIIDFIFKLAIFVAPLMVVIGGFMFLTSAGDIQKVAQGRRLMIWAAVGFAIILLAKALMAMLTSILGIE